MARKKKDRASNLGPKPPKQMSKKKLPRRIIPPEERPLTSILNYLTKGNSLDCALVSASFVENATGWLLESQMFEAADSTNQNEVNDLLNSPHGYLSTAGSRAQACYCLGLIDKNTYKNCKQIALVRNLFAHSHKTLDFDDSSVAPLCEGLHVSFADLDLSINQPKPTMLSDEDSRTLICKPRYNYVFAAFWTLQAIRSTTWYEQITDERGKTEIVERKRPVVSDSVTCVVVKKSAKHFSIGPYIFFPEKK